MLDSKPDEIEDYYRRKYADRSEQYGFRGDQGDVDLDDDIAQQTFQPSVKYVLELEHVVELECVLRVLAVLLLNHIASPLPDDFIFMFIDFNQAFLDNVCEACYVTYHDM